MSRARVGVAALLVLLLTGCGPGTDDRSSPSPAATTAPSDGGTGTAGPVTTTAASTSMPALLASAVSADGGPLTAAETATAVRHCLGKRAAATDVSAAHVDYARDIAYLTDDVLTLPTVILTSRGTRIVCNKDGRVPAVAGGTRVPDAEHPAVVVASAGITGTFNGPFADGMSPFAPCIVLRVTSEVAAVVMRLDWPTGDSVWYSAAIENGYAVVSGWMGGTIGSPVDIDLTTVRPQLRAYDAAGAELPVG